MKQMVWSAILTLCKTAFIVLHVALLANAVCRVPVLNELNHVNILNNTENKTEFPFNTSLEYRCVTGYGFERNATSHEIRTIKCQYNASFSPFEQCQILVCQVPVLNERYHVVILNNTMTETELPYATGLEYRCATGYGFEKNAAAHERKIIKCQDNASFSPFEQCEILMCPTPVIKDTDQVELVNHRSYKTEFQYGTVLWYQCATGYGFEENATTHVMKAIQCENNASFNPFQQCHILVCLVPVIDDKRDHLAILNNTYDMQKLPYDTVLEYKCVTGYGFETNSQTHVVKTTKCQDNALFSVLERCQRLVCKTPTTDNINYMEIVNNTKNETKLEYGTVLQYQCVTGYGFEETATAHIKKTIKCEDNATFSPLEDCHKLMCKTPTTNDRNHMEIVNNTKNETELGYGTVLQYQCVTGYGFEDTATEHIKKTMKCEDNATFSPLEDCHKLMCQVPTIDEKSDHVIFVNYTSNDALLPYGTVLQYQCVTGYGFEKTAIFHENETIKCQDNSTFSQFKQCQELVCLVPNTIRDHLTILNNTYYRTELPYNTVLEYKCVTGYGFEKNATSHAIKTIKCQDNTSFSNLKQCHRLVCQVPVIDSERDHLTLLNNTYGIKELPYDTVLEYKCVTGYGFEKNATSHVIKTIRCHDNSSFSNLKQCQTLGCHNIPAIRNAVQSRFHNDTTADIDCDEGYYNILDTQTAAISTTAIYCIGNGTWINLPTCIKKDCGKLDMLDISNAKSRLLFTDTKYQSNAVVTCDTGYTNPNKPQTADLSSTLIMCSVNGTWKNLPICVRKDCGDVHATSIDNSVNRRLHNDTKYMSTADVDCDEGYYIKNQGQKAGISTTTIRCSEHGTWVDKPTCVRKDCGPLGGLDIPAAKDRHLINDTKYNSIANISCDIGYKEENKWQIAGITSTLIRCNENGTWTNIPNCVKKDCERLYPPANGMITFAQHRTTYGSNATYACHEGYDIIGQISIHCEASGRWSDDTTHCQIKDQESKKMCFGCDDMSSPQYCDSVAHCQADEICFIESHHLEHGISFRSGCMNEKKCHMVEAINSSTVCVECCSNNMCNNKGCGNADFPSREHRGPMCFDCQHTGDPKTCDTVTMCTRNQVCSIEKYQWGDSFHYKQGCVHQVCNTLSRHTRSIPLCHSCCHDDFCNLNCTSNTYNNGEVFVG